MISDRKLLIHTCDLEAAHRVPAKLPAQCQSGIGLDRVLKAKGLPSRSPGFENPGKTMPHTVGPRPELLAKRRKEQ